MSAAEDPNLGKVLKGDFEILEPSGKGAMGTVYRSYQRSMDRVVAVKILRSELLGDQAILRRFLREARAIAKLQHPSIVTVHMAGETDDGAPFLVMEYIDGVSLEAMCEGTKLPLEQVLAIGKQIAAALAEAHDHGIVHRDLKPANILITETPGAGQLVKVVDFGIAKILHGDNADRTALTQEGIFGTPHYIAPEQATGGNIDHRVDIYALGVILFRLLSGRLPYEGGMGMQVVLKHLRDPVPHLLDLDPSLPAAIDELVARCMAKEPSARPASAEALLKEFDKVELNGRPAARAEAAVAIPIGVSLVESDETETPRRGFAVIVGAAAALVIGISGGLTVAVWHRSTLTMKKTNLPTLTQTIPPPAQTIQQPLLQPPPLQPQVQIHMDASATSPPKPILPVASAQPPVAHHRRASLPITVIEPPTTQVLPEKLTSPPSVQPSSVPSPPAPAEEAPAAKATEDPTNLPIPN